jgi:hypothetical protein
VDVRITVSLHELVKCVEIQYGTVLYCTDRYDLVEVTAADEED